MGDARIVTAGTKGFQWNQVCVLRRVLRTEETVMGDSAVDEDWVAWMVVLAETVRWEEDCGMLGVLRDVSVTGGIM